MEASGYNRYGKAYRKVGAVPENAVAEIRKFLEALSSDGVPMHGGKYVYGTSGARNLSDGALMFDLRLYALRMKTHVETHTFIRELANRHGIPWFEDLLLSHKPEDNDFIFSPFGELYAMVW